MGWFSNALAQQQQQANPSSGVQTGSLASLGLNSPQPVPGMSPIGLPTGPPMTGIDWDQHPIGSRPGEPGFDPNKGFNQILYPGGQLPPGWQPNTGGINPNQPQLGNRGSGQPVNQPMGNLQQFGLNPQSGQMVTMRSPDGSETQQVPIDQMNHWLSRGGVRM